MGSAVIEGYINENKKDNFTAYATPEHNYQFGGAIINEELSITKASQSVKITR